MVKYRRLGATFHGRGDAGPGAPILGLRTTQLTRLFGKEENPAKKL